MWEAGKVINTQVSDTKILGIPQLPGVADFRGSCFTGAASCFLYSWKTEQDEGLGKRKRDLLGFDEGFPGCEYIKGNMIFGMVGLQETWDLLPSCDSK